MSKNKLELVDELISNLELSRNEVISYLQRQDGSLRTHNNTESEELNGSSGRRYNRPYELSEYEKELYEDIGGHVDFA